MPAATSHAERYRQVAVVLTRHGLGAIAGVSGLDRWAALRHLVGGSGGGDDRRGNPERLRIALEELGTTFIKLGQLLSTRSDLLPPEYIAELSKLQTDAPPVPIEVARGVIAEELGGPPESLFATFDPVPLASASIGQAHAATLHDGTRVVVKIRRPHVIEEVSLDLEVMQNLAAQASRHWDLAADFNLVGLAAEFARTFRAELDYLHEARNAERFARNFAGDPHIHIPRVIWETTTSRVITLERIDGLGVSDIDGLDLEGIDRTQLVARAVGAIAKMVFADGFFHADPHPGNLFVEADGRIGLIDFGMAAVIDRPLRELISDLFIALTRKDPARIATAVMKLSVARRPVDREALVADLAQFISMYRGQSLGEIRVAPLITRVLAILRGHHLQLQPEMITLLRMLLMVEGMGVRLDPAFSLGEALGPYAAELTLERYSPRYLAKRMAQAGAEAVELSAALPERIRKLIDLIDTNGVEVHLRAAELDPLVARVERIGNRLVAGVIAAAFIRGIGELAGGDGSPWRAWSGRLMGAGLTVTGILSGYLALTSRRKRGRR